MIGMLSRSRLIGISTAAFAALLFAGTAGTAQAYQCKNGYVQTEAISPNHATSLASAKSFWTTKVKNSYGLAWSVWTIASAKSQNCGYTGTAYYCIVKAKPCLYVVP